MVKMPLVTQTVGRKRSSSGYDLRFAEPPPEDLVCQVCRLVAKEPQQISCCGKVFCETCIPASEVCPKCNKPAKTFPDLRSNKQIKLLKVSCPNEDGGCTWTGSLQDIEEHMRDCPYSEVSCPKGCEETLYRCDLQDHTLNKCRLRIYTCPYCMEEGVYEQIAVDHAEQKCMDVEITCPNSCGVDIPRRLLESHRSTCPNEPVECEYQRFGCRANPLRQDKRRHEEEDAMEHARLATQVVRTRTNLVNQLYKLLREARAFQTTPATLKMWRFGEFLLNGATWDSVPFFSTPGGYFMCLAVSTRGYEQRDRGMSISAYLHLMKGRNDDILPWPCRETLVIELLNQLTDTNHLSITVDFSTAPQLACQRSIGVKNAVGYGKTKFVAHRDLGYNSQTNVQFLKEDCLYFRVTARPQKPWLACAL